MPELALWQWAGIVCAVMVVMSPRVIQWVTRKYLTEDSPALAKATGDLAEPSVHAKIDAFATIAPDLAPQLAEEVWVAIQPLRGGRTDAIPME